MSHAWFLNYGLYGNRPYNDYCLQLYAGRCNMLLADHKKTRIVTRELRILKMGLGGAKVTLLPDVSHIASKVSVRVRGCGVATQGLRVLGLELLPRHVQRGGIYPSVEKQHRNSPLWQRFAPNLPCVETARLAAGRSSAVVVGLKWVEWRRLVGGALEQRSWVARPCLINADRFGIRHQGPYIVDIILVKG